VNVFAQEISVHHRRTRKLSRAATAVGVGVLGVLLGFVIAVGFTGASKPSLTLAVAGGVACLAVLALALARYEAAVALAMLIFGIVFVQPAPPDAVLMVAMAVAIVTGRFTLRRIPWPILALLGAFLILNLVSAVFATQPGRVAFFLMITTYLITFSVWITGFVNSHHRARVLVVPLVVGAVVTTAISIAILYLGLPGKSRIAFEGLRLRGLFKDANVFGPFCVFVALLIVSELLEPRLLRARRGTKLLLLIILAVGALVAYSRAAWLNASVAVLTMIVAYSLRRGGGRKAAAIILTIAILVGVGSVTLAATGSVGFLGHRAHEQYYDTQRFAAQRKGVELVQSYPFGIGPGQFEHTVGIAAHSLYVRALAEQGFLGLLVVLSILLATLGLAARNVVLGRDTFGIGSIPLLAAWCGILANSAFVDTIHWRHVWLIAGLIWAAAMRQPDDHWDRPASVARPHHQTARPSRSLSR
jgi:hypothetical protein